MKWLKLAEREGDFLKNYLLYENFQDNFPRVFNRHHCNFLTTRKRNTFTHYLDEEDAKNLSFFIKEQIQNNPLFMHDQVKIGKEHFKNLIQFSENLKNINHLSREELAEAAQEYFRLYKEPYPHFNLTVFSEELEKEGNTEIINLMADWRLFARTHFNKTHDLINPLFEEIAKRLDLSVEEVKFLKPEEIIQSLQIESKIKRRQNCYFLFQEGKFILKEDEIYPLAEEFFQEVKGMGTFPAKYTGRVRLIKSNDDLTKVENGEILVLRMTTPDLMLESIQKAGAIITDEGGITCHAAVLSREFNIPALMGTGNATKLFRTGDLIEVDTKLGLANKINSFEKN